MAHLARLTLAIFVVSTTNVMARDYTPAQKDVFVTQALLYQVQTYCPSYKMNDRAFASWGLYEGLSPGDIASPDADVIRNNVRDYVAAMTFFFDDEHCVTWWKRYGPEGTIHANMLIQRVEPPTKGAAPKPPPAPESPPSAAPLPPRRRSPVLDNRGHRLMYLDERSCEAANLDCGYLGDNYRNRDYGGIGSIKN